MPGGGKKAGDRGACLYLRVTIHSKPSAAINQLVGKALRLSGPHFPQGQMGVNAPCSPSLEGLGGGWGGHMRGWL